jgi:hypothetical protein
MDGLILAGEMTPRAPSAIHGRLGSQCVVPYRIPDNNVLGITGPINRRPLSQHASHVEEHQTTSITHILFSYVLRVYRADARRTDHIVSAV